VQPRRILITGTSKGMGQALALQLADLGHVIVGCSRGAGSIEHPNYLHFQTDITDDGQVRELFGNILREHKGIDVLINNAGRKIDGPALLATSAQALEMIGINLAGTLSVTREALKLMKRGRFGRVINISSIAVPLGSVGTSYYGATKAAVTQYAHTVVRELGGDDITINTIGISVFEASDMAENIDAKALAKARASLVKPNALTIDEIGHAVDFFISDLAGNVTDQIIYFGGVR
jgi:3-oxoacyl-[acyl-carrier protein] reductase